jgi:hypothetical protein
MPAHSKGNQMNKIFTSICASTSAAMFALSVLSGPFLGRDDLALAAFVSGIVLFCTACILFEFRVVQKRLSETNNNIADISRRKTYRSSKDL